MTEPKCGFTNLPDGHYEVYAGGNVIGYADNQVQAAVMIAMEEKK